MITRFLINRGMITLIPVEKTFFVIVDFQSDARLSYESVLFNYQNLTPYKEAAVSYVQYKDKLLMWFYDALYQNIWNVPEGFLFYHYFSTTDKNILVTVAEKVTFVIENGTLVYQAPCNQSFCEDKNILIKKYHVEEVIEKNAQWYQQHQKAILNRPISLLMKHFINRKRLIQNIQNKLAFSLIPLALFLGIITGIQYISGYYLEKKMAELSNQKSITGKKVRKIFQQTAENRTAIADISNFLEKYRVFNLDILDALTKVFHKFDVHMYYVVHNRKTLTLRMYCKKVEDMLSELSKISSISSYKLTRQRKKDNSISDITLEISLKRKNISE